MKYSQSDFQIYTLQFLLKIVRLDRLIGWLSGLRRKDEGKFKPSGMMLREKILNDESTDSRIGFQLP